MNFDHHNGKVVKSVTVQEGETSITFETDEIITVPGELSVNLVGQSLLLVENGQLIFGYSYPNKPASREVEIPTGEEELVEEDDVAPEEAKKGANKGTGGRQKPSKGTNG